MGRAATVVPLLGWRPAQAGEHAAKGLPLADLWEAVERYVWDRPGVAGKTSANRRRTRQLARTLPPHPTPVDVMGWLTTLDAMFAPGTVENHRKALAAVYRYGSDLGLCQGNPAALVSTSRTWRPSASPRRGPANRSTARNAASRPSRQTARSWGHTVAMLVMGWGLGSERRRGTRAAGFPWQSPRSDP